MLKWRTSVATLPRMCYATSTVVAVVLVLVYHSYFFSSFPEPKSQGSPVFRFDLFNMLLTDMDVGKTVLGQESEAAN